MGSPYTSQSASGYNSSAPADDGSQVASNRITWAGVKTKLADPVKTLADNINSALVTAFGKVLGSNGVRSTAIDYTVQSTDQGKVIKCTAACTITTPAAATVGSPFCFAILNLSSGSVVVDGNSSETVDGGSTISIPAGGGVTIETDGTNWFTHGQNYIGTISQPQGRLTLTSGTPILAADVSAATSVYYTPYVGNLCPIYTGTIYQMRTFSELTLTLQNSSTYSASTIYDIFIFDSSGAVTIGVGPAWSTSTAGSCARGTGAATTELELKNGLWTNKVSMTMHNAGSSYSVAANCGTYVGSILMDGTNGQVSCLIAYGLSRKWGIWNAYNRMPIRMKAGDTTATWTYNTATLRASNNAAVNCNAFTGLAEESVEATFLQNLNIGTNTQVAFTGIGYNSTTAASGFLAQSGGTNGVNSFFTMIARHVAVPALGQNVITALEKGGGSATNTWQGGEDDNQLIVSYRG